MLTWCVALCIATSGCQSQEASTNPSVATVASSADADADSTRQGLELFEAKVRPLLIARCSECHGPDVQEAGLRLDQPQAILRGGESGPVIKPGLPDESLLVTAVQYQTALQMPPDGKIPNEEAALLVDWVSRGAPLPASATDEDEPAPLAAEDFDYAQRLDHWCYRPLAGAAPPSVDQPAWCVTPIDAFVLAELQRADLPAAAPADRRTWLRRLAYDLTGLPPSRDDLEQFAGDDAPEAASKRIDRLLASPHYGERWGRHWLDLVRFAETLGHEFDFDLYNSWRYRDYVVEAFNEDLPYDQFVREHLAGDLLPTPRRDVVTGANRSIVATGCFWLGEAKHSPVDVRLEEAERVDNQIDVLGKAILAQTVGCARCHDHKFDAISSQDYYALFGYVKSSRYQQAFLGGPPELYQGIDEVRRLRDEVLAEYRRRLQSLSRPDAQTWAQYLTVATEAQQRVKDGPAPKAVVDQLASRHGLDAAWLSQWCDALRTAQRVGPPHPLYAWRRLAMVEEGAAPFDERQQLLAAELRAEQSARQQGAAEVPPLASYVRSGEAFLGLAPGLALLGREPQQAVQQIVTADVIHTGRLALSLEGELRSPSFQVSKKYLHVWSVGQGARLNVVVDGFAIIRDPVYGGLTTNVNEKLPRWRTFDLGMWQGHRAYLEGCDSVVPVLGNVWNPNGAQPDRDGFIEIQTVVASDEKELPPPADAIHLELAEDASLGSAEALALAYGRRLAEAHDWWVESGTGDEPAQQHAALVSLLIRLGAFDMPEAVSASGMTPQGLAALVKQYHEAAQRLPLPWRAPALADDAVGQDERVMVRGSPGRLGAVSPRRAPRLIEQFAASAHSDPFAAAPGDFVSPANGSGRLALAERLLGPGQPLVARVIANRLWQHHFGRGLAATPDDFGRMGQPPTHPELLDWLANDLIRSGWSLKSLHRKMLASNVYAQSSHPAEATQAADPVNRLWGRMPVRRLEAEAIRDTMLALGDRLDERVGGPGVSPFLTMFMEGTGRPGQSGPLDGQGRRSLYINVRRNFLTPLLVAFDYPVPFSTMGRRNQSNVPAQALALLHDPFVTQSAERWSQRLLSEPVADDNTDMARLAAMFELAFARQPAPDELAAAQEFLSERGGEQAEPVQRQQAWTELAHMLLNVKELIYLP